MMNFFFFLADDVKIFRMVNTLDDCLLLQNDLDNLLEWSVKNSLELNNK